MSKTSSKPAPAAAVPDEPEERRVRVADPTMRPRMLTWKNIAFDLSAILLWCAFRFLFIRLKWGAEWQFKKYDVLFILAPATGAFFLNWYWLREQRTNVMTKWAIVWAIIDVAIFACCVIFGAHPLHQWLTDLSTT